MALTAAICTQCGAQIQVDESKEAGICPSCGTAFITEKVIHQFVTQNNFAGATINVQGGVDTENLYTLARRAVETNNTDDVLRYYGQIREREPNDWEATFFYAWFANSENFHSDFKIVEALIFKLDIEKQIEAVKRIYDFFKKINFTLEVNYGEKSRFPLQDQKLYYDFVIKFFDEKNSELIWQAQYLINYMEYWGNIGRQRFYFEILSRKDKLYAPFLQNYHEAIYSSPAKSQNKKEAEFAIRKVESTIKELNDLIDSEEDKKNNFLDYYKWLIEDCADYLKPANLKYVENKIKELDSSYFVSEESRKAFKRNLGVARAKQCHNNIKIVTNFLFLLMSIAGIICFYFTGHPFRGTLALIFLLILNLFMLTSEKTSTRIVLKVIIFHILLAIIAYLVSNEFYMYL